jgi:TRAP-type C4-dicarboxylate transport system permease small subunit
MFGFIGGATLVMMMLFTMYDVIQRQFTQKPLIGTTEIMSIAFCVMLYASYGYTQVRHGHIHVTIVPELLKGRSKFVLWAVTSIVGAATGVFLAWATYLQTMKVIGDGTYTQMLYIPFGPVYVVCFIGTILFAVALILDAIKAVLATFDREYAREICKDCFIKQNHELY